MNFYNNGDKVYTVGDIDKLERENAELKARVEKLQRQKEQMQLGFDDYKRMQNISDAEVKAQAVEEYCASFESMCVNQLDEDDVSQEMIDGWKAGIMDCRIAGRKYANQLRQKAKACE